MGGLFHDSIWVTAKEKALQRFTKFFNVWKSPGNTIRKEIIFVIPLILKNHTN
jgi:hypothetical protein